MRRIGLAAMVVLAPALFMAQAPLPARFEVASVKLAPTQTRGGPRPFTEENVRVVRVLAGGRVESSGHTLRNIIAWTWNVNSLYQKIEGNREALETEYVISAKAAASSLTLDEARTMVRTLLEERFQLRWRLQSRDVDGYVLMPAREDGRPGPGLRAFTGDCDARQSTSVRFDSPDYEQQARCVWTGINSMQRAVGQSMMAIAERLTFFMATPVSDRTGWTGLFTFDILADTRNMPFEAVMRSRSGLALPPSTDEPQLLDVFRRELGLKLVKEPAAVNDFIVERVEPLIEN